MNRPPSFAEFMASMGITPAPGLKRQEGPPLLYPQTQGDPPPPDYYWNGNTGSPNPEDKYSGGTALWNNLGSNGAMAQCPAGTVDYGDGRCQKACSGGMVLDPATGGCVYPWNTY